ncbi:hypothetical protein PIB30_102810, partial [Stylosanthes scabra]|nr:hypothetical protein [Stylosanthes scabra]
MMLERSSPARCFVTPPQPQSSSWTTRHSSSSSRSPNMALSESESKASPSPSVASSSSFPQNKDDLFHVIHKVPAGDSPYVKAKQVQ